MFSSGVCFVLIQLLWLKWEGGPSEPCALSHLSPCCPSVPQVRGVHITQLENQWTRKEWGGSGEGLAKPDKIARTFFPASYSHASFWSILPDGMTRRSPLLQEAIPKVPSGMGAPSLWSLSVPLFLWGSSCCLPWWWASWAVPAWG